MSQNKIDILLETVNYCNLRCPACPWHNTMTREKRKLLPEEFLRIFEHISPYAKSICFYVMGEPLLNEHLFEYVKAAHEAGIHTGFSTNGMLLGKYIDDVFRSGLDFIQIALDGLEAETHERYRIGSDFSLIVENLRLLAQEKKTRGSELPEIRIQTLISRQNEYRLPEFRAFADELGIGFSAKKMMFGKTEDVIDKNRAVFEPEQKKYRRLDNSRLRYYKDMAECPQLNGITILCNGDVVPCCYDYDGKVILGNLIYQTWEEIVNGGTNKEFRKKRAERNVRLCASCDMVMENKMNLPAAVFFDFGRTLVIMPDIDIRKGIHFLLENLGLKPDKAMVEQYYIERENFVSRMCSDKRRRMIYPEIKIMEYLFDKFHIKTEKSPTELEQLFSDGCSAGMPTEGSAELLKALRSLGVLTGVITNNRYSEETVRWKMKKLFPDHEFDLIFSSSEVGVHKPDKKIFEEALKRLQINPEKVWFVGDSLEDDIQGAAQVEMIPFWYVKHAKNDITKCICLDDCHVIWEWRELKKLLESCTG